MKQLVDIHNHVLPIDDGAQTYDESLIMLKTAVESHISTLFITPHMIPKGKYDPSIKKIKEYTVKLKELALSHNLPIEIKLGSELQINTDSYDAIIHKKYIGYEDTDYVLVEFIRPLLYYGIVDQALEELIYQGKKIIIAHPERYFESVDEAVNMCRKWVHQGYYLQVNRTSLVHNKFKLHKKIVFKLIELNLIHIIASDAHHINSYRELKLDDVYAYILKGFGLQCANTLLVKNPTFMMQNKPLINSRVHKSIYYWLCKAYIQLI